VKLLHAMRVTALFLFLFVFGLTTILVLDKTGLMPILAEEIQHGIDHVKELAL
jgi:hypothetical protein